MKRDLINALRKMSLNVNDSFLESPTQMIFEEGERLFLERHSGGSLDRMKKDLKEIVDNYELDGFKVSSIRKDAISTIKCLRRYGLKLAMVTNDGLRATNYALEEFGLSGYWDSIVTRDDVEKWKPYPEPVQKTIFQLGVKGEDCMFVGDSTIDILAAKSSGIKVAVIAKGVHSADHLRSDDPDYFINSLSDLITIVEKNIHE